MSTILTFGPPPWVTALILRPPPPSATQPRAPPSPMRDLVAQWLVYVTDDSRTPTTHAPHVIARFRGWLAFVFRLPTFVRRRKTPLPEQPQELPTAQFSLIEESLNFSSTMKESKPPPEAVGPTVSEETKPKKKRSKNIKKDVISDQTFKLSPLYRSLYFADAEKGEAEQNVPQRCESPSIESDVRDKRCVQSFFLTDATGEGKGILEGLREMKAQSAEPQRKRGWVPAVVSLILIALNPLK